MTNPDITDDPFATAPAQEPKRPKPNDTDDLAERIERFKLDLYRAQIKYRLHLLPGPSGRIWVGDTADLGRVARQRKAGQSAETLAPASEAP